MKRSLIIAMGALVLANLGLFFSGYGIRLQEKPCTHFIGIGTYTNYLVKECLKFGKWELADTPPALP